MPLLSTYSSATGRSYGARLESPVATYSLTVSGAVTSVNEGSSVSFNLTGTDIVDDTFYWTINHITTADADFSPASGSFSVVSNSGTFTVTTSADLTTEGSQTFTVSVRRVSTSGVIVATSDVLSPITINDTSLTPTISISPALNGSTSIGVSPGSTVSAASCGTWTFTPSNTFTAYVKCWGGGGGAGHGALNIVTSGGGGGYVAGYVTFYSGTSYQFLVGCAGTCGGAIRYGGGGGGGTGLRLTTGSIPIMIAGGGGGSGFQPGTMQGGAGGGGGANGGGGTGGSPAATGGTQFGPGAGGSGVNGFPSPTQWGASGSGSNGGAGYTGSSGSGSAAGLGSGGSGGYDGSAAGGGGGGGGYKGGGGGGMGYAGGGGSGYYDTNYCYSVDGASGSGRTPGNSTDADRGTAGGGAYGLYTPASGNPGLGYYVNTSYPGKFYMTIV